ncbi:MAG: glycine cleavage system protein GcvH [Verrucomicrobiota bacterium]|jgi:glycine cleavage system H protein|nr:glycine cleavage system protein GcvH [Verrucomicrobiota bacterium]HAY74287.1 glycine cleavage system protein GcvH [Opitutae bacterium]HBJ60538.1 glycine cleavage system protein GcvH [Opitutae bacterium]|tara:strand:+ start:2171 stop:2557 length:387 start_codon:yes stop_codon:yes gene_type:complete
MSTVPEDLLYTKEHEWIKELDDGSCLVGITHHAQDSLGDVTFVELPSPGTLYEGNAVFGVVESVKAASDLYMPITGEVLEVNEALNDAPEQVNDDPYGAGWMIKIQPSSPPRSSGLLDSSSYSGEIAE